MIYAYSKPNQMIGHRFTDDVAVVKALTKKQAVKKLRRLYDLSDEDIENCVYKVDFRLKGVSILTDY